ncbi:phage head closure protein [Pseudomonas tohonis]|uniref:phage head closure protein n=1 Tax=Pseudomonas sp. zfem005 TaxID=3078200 RepID=UPI0003975680|nr:phage head closure protein [Pseudomonas sp. zfem005]EQM72022.1 head-tail adaptor protein [Pseudomonas alcaligenes OT 69]MDN4145972.1 phage head closure protein [Pseudomonas tohonis]MDU9415306.1 phage head closure protein [Pseudomonas sp. zfem005]
MRAGTLRHQVVIEAPQHEQDPETGAMRTTWVEWARVWARIEPLSARDFIAAQAVQSEVTARITIRYREGVTAAMRINHSGRLYNIHGVLPDARSGREYLTLPASEGVNHG